MEVAETKLFDMEGKNSIDSVFYSQLYQVLQHLDFTNGKAKRNNKYMELKQKYDRARQ